MAELKYKIHLINGYSQRGVEELERLLNDGWRIERTDSPGDSGFVVYVLKRADDRSAETA